MTEQEGLERLLDFPASSLGGLAESFLKGVLRHGVTQSGLASHLGSATNDFLPWFRARVASGWSAEFLGWQLTGLHLAKNREEAMSRGIDLVLSGPEVQGTPVVDTPTVVHSLFSEAREDVLIASYVFHSAGSLLEPLARRHDQEAGFRVRFVVDLSHQRTKPEEPLPLVAGRFKKDFLSNQWPGERPPELWHDPRVFTETEKANRGVMHAKVVVIDNVAALVTSANFTQAAHHRNIEAGVLFRAPRQVRRIRSYFEGLMQTKLLSKL